VPFHTLSASRPPPAAADHAAHLAHGACLVGEELQPLLAQHRVDAPVREAEIERAALEPFDRRSPRRRQRPRDADHAGVEIDSDDVPGRTDPLGGDARHHAGAACHVEHALARREPRGVDQQRRPPPEDVARHIAFVELGRVADELPGLLTSVRVAHRPPQPSLREMRAAACVTALICSGGGDAGMYWIEPAIATAPT
jgi:hypothetical protein